MHKHPFFQLYLHDSNELESFLQAEITERDTLQEWPLSCVERLVMADGRRWVYKSQFGPTVEPEFYSAVQSELLPLAQVLPSDKEKHSHMLFKFIDAPLLSDLNLSAQEAIEISQAVLEAIKNTGEKIPYYLDISSREKWKELVEVLLTSLGSLISQNVFMVVDEPALRSLHEAAFSDSVVRALKQDVGLVHHDLKGENVFVLTEGFKVIDWQRPILGPRALDLLTLLSSLKLEPEAYVDKGSIFLSHILHIHWFVECALKWFPEGNKTYDESVSKLIKLITS